MTPNPPIWLLNNNNNGEWTIFTISVTVFLVACVIVLVLVYLQIKREERVHRKARESWGAVADRNGFEFQDLGVQDMVITGRRDGFEVRVEIEEAPGGNLLSDMPALSTRLVVRAEGAMAAKNIVLIRDKLITDETELTELIDEGLETARAHNAPV